MRFTDTVKVYLEPDEVVPGNLLKTATRIARTTGKSVQYIYNLIAQKLDDFQSGQGIRVGPFRIVASADQVPNNLKESDTMGPFEKQVEAMTEGVDKEHFRCRNCGAEFSRDKGTGEQELESLSESETEVAMDSTGTPLKVNDRVKWSRMALANLKPTYGDLSSAKGVVKSLKPYRGASTFSQSGFTAIVVWDDEGTPDKTNTRNLTKDRR